MSMKRKFLTLLTFIFLIPFSSAQAATLLMGDKISVEADEVIEDDYYVSVGSLGTTVMSGVVQGDMYALAGSVTANGSILGDFGSVSGLTYMHASVTDDVRIVSAEAVIDDYVGGDVFVIAGSLKILSTAKIEGDVIFFGMEGEINGDVGGSIYGTANTLRIDNHVGGKVDVTVTRDLTLGSKANVAGDVSYYGLNKLTRAQDSVVSGEIHKKEMAVDDVDSPWQNILIPMFITLFATLTLYLIFKREMQAVVKTIFDSPLSSGLLGFSTLMIGPFVSLLLITTVLGMLLGVFGIGAILLLISIGFALAVVLTGALLSRLLIGKYVISLLWIIAGAVVFHGMLLIPVLGFLIAVALVAMSIGGALLTLYRRAR